MSHADPNLADALPPRFVVRVDGVGSVLVVRSAAVVVGPVGGATPADVAVVADPAAPPVRVDRRDDDYFLTVGGDRRLLAAGEPVAVTSRCRFVFRLPCPASTSAVLAFTTACLAGVGGDVRRVVLMDRDVVIGPGPAAHLPAPIASAVVLHLRAGRLVCRGEPVPVGRTVSVGGLSLSIAAV